VYDLLGGGHVVAKVLKHRFSAVPISGEHRSEQIKPAMERVEKGRGPEAKNKRLQDKEPEKEVRWGG
jgi:hypothetical protein